jgi:hypothetical protein
MYLRVVLKNLIIKMKKPASWKQAGLIGVRVIDVRVTAQVI